MCGAAFSSGRFEEALDHAAVCLLSQFHPAPVKFRGLEVFLGQRGFHVTLFLACPELGATVRARVVFAYYEDGPFSATATPQELDVLERSVGYERDQK